MVEKKKKKKRGGSWRGGKKGETEREVEEVSGENRRVG